MDGWIWKDGRRTDSREIHGAGKHGMVSHSPCANMYHLPMYQDQRHSKVYQEGKYRLVHNHVERRLGKALMMKTVLEAKKHQC